MDRVKAKGFFILSLKRCIPITNFIVDLLFELGGEILGHFIPSLAPESKFEKNIIRLKEEDWFSVLEKDYRYGYIIYQNRTVKRFLSSEKNVKMITSMDEEKENFIRLVKEEHAKFTGLH